MKAVILAAGRGSRLGRLTAERPKCLLTVAGRSLIAWQLQALRQAGLDDIAVVRGHAGACLNRHSVPGTVTCIDNPDWVHSEMPMSLYAAQTWLGDADCVVSYADILYPAAAVRTLLDTPAPDAAILYDPDWRDLWQRRLEDPDADVERFALDRRGRITGLSGPPITGEAIDGRFIGLFTLTAKTRERLFATLADLPEARRHRTDMTGALDLLIRGGLAISGQPYTGGWMEIDEARDLDLAETMVRQGALPLGGPTAGTASVNGRQSDTGSGAGSRPAHLMEGS